MSLQQQEAERAEKWAVCMSVLGRCIQNELSLNDVEFIAGEFGLACEFETLISMMEAA